MVEKKNFFQNWAFNFIGIWFFLSPFWLLSRSGKKIGARKIFTKFGFAYPSKKNPSAFGQTLLGLVNFLVDLKNSQFAFRFF